MNPPRISVVMPVYNAAAYLRQAVQSVLDQTFKEFELIAVDEKSSMMAKMGKKTLDITLAEPLPALPSELSDWNLELNDSGHMLRYQFDSHAERTGIASLMRRLGDLGIAYKDLSTHQSSLEDIFVELVHGKKEPA